MKISPGIPIGLAGTAYQRGRQQHQWNPEFKPFVIQAVSERRNVMKTELDDPEVQSFLDSQWAFTEQQSPESLAEITGIAEGYGVQSKDLFAYLHLGVIDDRIGQEDGCTAFAIKQTSHGTILAKNRDYQGAHQKLQQVFLNSDPAWGERRCLFVGSLGSPGAFSSGMNSDGLAVADNRIGWSTPGIGWLRYFLMTKILTDSSSVDEALDLIRSVDHVGGGSIVMADQSGKMATVELGQGQIHVETQENTFIGHTNHYLHPRLAQFATPTPNDPMAGSSRGRLDKINTGPIAQNSNISLENIAEFLGTHGGKTQSLCRHGIDGDSLTISSVIFCCQKRELYYCPGRPCETDWQVYTLSASIGSFGNVNGLSG